LSFEDRAAILLDGEYVKKTLGKRLRRFPSDTDVMGEVGRILSSDPIKALLLYRVFYYTADPLTGKALHPLTRAETEFGSSSAFSRNTQLIDRLENQPDVAVRRGTLAHQGWQIGRAAARELTRGNKNRIDAEDIVPKIHQKGVDMRIGLDIASLALKRLVSTVVLVTGDSDLVPAMKFARREGLRVYLDTLGSQQVRPELKIHADRIL
jgi:uncharacterized LabA/DUF88 family protein